MLAMSNRYRVEPRLADASRWNSGSWVRGEHEATTTRLRSCSSIISLIVSWVSCEQVNRLCSRVHHVGQVPAYVRPRSGTSTTRADVACRSGRRTRPRVALSRSHRSRAGSPCWVRVLRPGQRLPRPARRAEGLGHGLGDVLGRLERRRRRRRRRRVVAQRAEGVGARKAVLVQLACPAWANSRASASGAGPPRARPCRTLRGLRSSRVT